MSTYRFLEDHYVNNNYFPAGSSASTADVGGALPSGWVPTGNVDPQDTPAINAFFAAGVQLPGLIRGQFALVPVAAPIVYWQHIQTIGGSHLYQLTTPQGQALGTKFGPPPGSNN